MTAGDLLHSLRTGRIEGISVPDLLWQLCSSGRTGVLTLRIGTLRKRVYLQDGRIVFAASNDPDERLGEQLLREGTITLEQLDHAILRLGTGKRLGALLVEAGHLTPHNLVRGILAQVKNTVLSLFPWEEGDYTFDEGPLPTEEVITLAMHTGELLRQGIRRIHGISRVRASVGGARTFYRLRPGWEERIEGMNLSEGERLLLRRLRGGGATVAALCGEVFLSNFEIYQTLWAFKITGVVEEADAFADRVGAGLLEGRLGPESFADLLLRLGGAGETGLLHVCQGIRERTFHLRQGRCVFATSDSLDDGLVAYLFRRGVISIKHRDEVARRLLVNERVGTTLAGMGVLDQEDLEAMIREHVLEIVLGTFEWEEADWGFSPGELPTQEEITLEVSLERLVTEGMRRILSWTRIREGIGGLDVIHTLTPDHLAVLDRMEIGRDEWEVVSSLRQPKTVGELCRTAALGDFRVGQLLWSLKLLGAIRECSPEELAPAAEAPTETVSAFSTEPTQEIHEAREETGSEALPHSTVIPPQIPSAGEEAPVDVPRGTIVSSSPDTTVAISRKDIEAALQPASDADFGESERSRAEEVEAAPPWDPPRGLDREIARFNERHRTLYRVIRSEVGAGAGNFVKSCRGALVNGVGDALASVELQPDGSWDEQGLRRVIVEQRIEAPLEGFHQLLEREIERLRAHIGEARAQALRDSMRTPEPPAAPGQGATPGPTV